jgi:Adenylate and Guanylate cyclase catalytic domain/AAA ATPase domain
VETPRRSRRIIAPPPPPSPASAATSRSISATGSSSTSAGQTAREDDPEGAIRAGLAILDAMGPLNGTLAAGTQLAVRIGMHTGPVVIGDDGAVFGDTANVAARVQAAADPDTVVITAATQRLVAGMFVVEDRGPQTLKGVREPVTLYRIVQPSGVRSRLDVAAGRLSRFVGREVELATLVDRWERAQDGEGQTVVVLGEAGMGKSRLVYQLHEHLAAGAAYVARMRRHAVHRGHAIPSDHGRWP